MSKLEYANSFRDLIAYRKARELSLVTFQITECFPKKEDYSFTDQIWRAIGVQVSEAWEKRQSEKHFLSKLTDADGEQQETQPWIETARDCRRYISQEVNQLLEKCTEIGRLLGGMMAKAEQFCRPFPYKISEEQADYFVDSPTGY